MIDEKREVIFIENPKCGCHSIRRALLAGGVKNDFIPTAHMTAPVIACRWPLMWRRFFRFVVVRHPVQHKHSAFFEFRNEVYREDRIKAETPEEWARQGFPCPVSLQQTEYAVCADLIMKLEGLESYFPELCEHTGVALELFHEHSNRNRPEPSEEFAQLVNGAYPEEHTLFGYDLPYT